jgi:uncharacterized protein with HEPN domain
MGNKTLVYKARVSQHIQESYKHLKRLDSAFMELEKRYTLPLNQQSYEKILKDNQSVAYTDQVIYRFSKLQDTMGAKLFKSLLLYQGENIDKPFLDILNNLEKMDIIDVEEWFEIRDLRNEIAHDYDNNDCTVVEILNNIYELKSELKKILAYIEKLLNKCF